jgi:hypothetical protein
VTGTYITGGGVVACMSRRHDKEVVMLTMEMHDRLGKEAKVIEATLFEEVRRRSEDMDAGLRREVLGVLTPIVTELSEIIAVIVAGERDDPDYPPEPVGPEQPQKPGQSDPTPEGLPGVEQEEQTPATPA